MNSKLTFIGFLILAKFNLVAQMSLEWNLFTDWELSKAGDQSHYFYNEIHRNTTDWKLDIAQLNGLTKLRFSDHWALNTQLLVERSMGQKFGLFNSFEEYRVILSQVNLTWQAKEKPFALKLGRFISPFGRFYPKQIPGERTILTTPLAYSFYTNISDRLGFVGDLGETYRPLFEEGRDWGLPTLYRLGYTTGLLGIWGKPEKTTIEVAVIAGAPNVNPSISRPIKLGLISHLMWRLNYFSKIGFSFSHGSFLQDYDNRPEAFSDNLFGQSLVGGDFEIGFGFWAISGEVIVARYQVPQFNSEDLSFVDGDPLSLWSSSFYLDLKYEMPFLPGSYLAYRIDHLGFGNGNLPQRESENWDDGVWRHVLGWGYKIREWMVLKGVISTQMVKNRSWDQEQRTFRLLLSLQL